MKRFEGAVPGFGLFDHAGDAEAAVADALAAADDAVFVRLGRVAFLDRDDVAAGLLVELDHLLQAARGRPR